MKQKIKQLVSYFISRLDAREKAIPVQDLSIFFAVLISSLILKKNLSKKIVLDPNYKKTIKSELDTLKQSFPELVTVFLRTESLLNKRLVESIFLKLQLLFNDPDEDMDEIISWSYQFLKRDLEKTAFKKLGKNKTKIEGEDLLFTTQFFTDKYMVKYLVDETLSNFNKSNIKEITVIDCACGGGNFLNYAFESLFKKYKTFYPKLSNQKIVDSILSQSILGFDLDKNLAKIASLSLFTKASKYAKPSKKLFINVFAGSSGDIFGFLSPAVVSCKIQGLSFEQHLEILNRKKRTKVFLTNPPFMGKRDMDTTLKNFLMTHFPESKGDLCISFFQKIIQSMSPRDVVGVVVQNNWMYLSSLKEFRSFFLKNQVLRKCVDLGSNAFEDINGEKTNVALCVACGSESKKSVFYNLRYYSLSEKKFFVNRNTIPKEITYQLNQSKFLTSPNLDFNYQLEDRFTNIKHLPLYAQFGNPMQGTSTGDNTKFVKFAWEVNGSPDWKLVSKGGGFSKWAGLNYYKVHWGSNADLIRANKGSALRNIDKIPSTQLVFSDTGSLGLNVRVLKDNQVFIASGPGIQVLQGNKYAHLAFLNSRIVTFLLKLINPKFTISAGYISKIPVANGILNSNNIAEKSERCLVLKEKYLKGKLPNFEFEHFDYSKIKNINSFIDSLILSDILNDYERLFLEFQIETQIKNKYNFSESELSEIKNVVGESPFLNQNKRVAITSIELDRLISSSIDINCLSTSRAINGYSVGSESMLEDLSYKLNVNPSFLLDLIKSNISSLPVTRSKYLRDLLHKIILHELGMEKIFSYKFEILNINQFFSNLVVKYPFLSSIDDLLQLFSSVINTHHKTSFFNKPLISVNNKSLTVGQEHA